MMGVEARKLLPSVRTSRCSEEMQTIARHYEPRQIQNLPAFLHPGSS